MPDTGVALSLRFSFTNQLGVIGNEIPRSSTNALPDMEEFYEDLEHIIFGTLIKCSGVRYRLKESEKAALPAEGVARYSRFDISGTFGDLDNPGIQHGFFLTNLHSSVSLIDIVDFIKDNCKLPDGTAPTKVFLGSPLYRA